MAIRDCLEVLLDLWTDLRTSVHNEIEHAGYHIRGERHRRVDEIDDINLYGGNLETKKYVKI